MRIRHIRTTASIALTALLLAVSACGNGGDSDSGDKKSAEHTTDKNTGKNADEKTGKDADGASAGATNQPQDTARDLASADRLVKAAFDATYGLRSLSTSGTDENGTVSLRVESRDGEPLCQTKIYNDTMRMELRLIGSQLYSIGNEAAYRGGSKKLSAAQVEAIAGRWLIRPSGRVKEAGPMCDRQLHRTHVEDELPAPEELRDPREMTRTTYRGRPSVRITYPNATGALELHIAAEGTPYLLSVTGTEAGMDWTYDPFAGPLRIAAPEGAVAESEIMREVLGHQPQPSAETA